MTDARRHANRLLGATHIRTGEAALPGYQQAKGSGWWTEIPLDPTWGSLIGIHEAQAGHSERAFLVLEQGLLRVGADAGPAWIPFIDMVRPKVEGLSKDPVSTSVQVLTTRGPVEFEFPRGGAFTFCRFVRKVAGG